MKVDLHSYSISRGVQGRDMHAHAQLGKHKLGAMFACFNFQGRKKKGEGRLQLGPR
jgi:hypothetical protein